eukprot:gene29354-38434_t
MGGDDLKPGTFVSTRYGDGIILGNTYVYCCPSSTISIKSRKQMDDQNKTVQSDISVSNIVDIDIEDKDDECLIEKSTRRSKYGSKTSRRSISGTEKKIVDLTTSSSSLVKIQLSYGIAYISIKELHAFDKLLSVDISSSTRVGLGSHSINRKDLFLCSPKQLFNDSTSYSSQPHLPKSPTIFTQTHWSLAIICNIHLLKARSLEVSAARKKKEDSNATAKTKDRTDNSIEFSSTSSGRKLKSSATKPGPKGNTKAPISLYDELLQATDADRELPCILLLDSAKCHRAQQIFANLRIYLQLMLFGAASFPPDASPDSEVLPDADAAEKSLVKNGKGTPSATASSRKRKRNATPANSEPPILIDLSEDIADSAEVVLVTEADSLEVTSVPRGHESDDVSNVPAGSSEEGMVPMEADLEDPPCTDAFVSDLNNDLVAHESLASVHMESMEDLHSPVPTTAVVTDEIADEVKDAFDCEVQNLSTATPMEEGVVEPSLTEVAADLKERSVAPKASKSKSSMKSSRPHKPELLVNPVSLPGFSLAVPLQMNGYDCGPFMLEFISKFSDSTPTIDKAFLQAKGGDVFKRCWNTDSGTVDVMGCRSTILRHLMPYKEFLTST